MNSLVKYILRKIAYSFLVLIGVVVIVFFLFTVLPGDPAQMTLGQRSDVQSLEAVRKDLGLDKPLPIQFLYFISDLSPISIESKTPESQQKYHYWEIFPISKTQILVTKIPYLRRSYQTKREVSDILGDTIPNTLILAFSSMVFATLIGIFLGVMSALYKDSWVDKLSIGVSIFGISAPSFFIGIIIAWFFGFVIHNITGLNMTGSLFNYDPFLGKVLDLRNLILPMITLGLRPLAIITQLTRSSMLEVLSQDYIRTARAKGLPESQVIYKHALKNALNPVLTAVSGWFASLLAGSFFVEYIFGFNGLGKATVDALELNDFPVVMGSILFVASIFVVINVVVDILYGFLDPRVSL